MRKNFNMLKINIFMEHFKISFTRVHALLVIQPIFGLFWSSFYVVFSNCNILPVSNVPVFCSLLCAIVMIRLELGNIKMQFSSYNKAKNNEKLIGDTWFLRGLHFQNLYDSTWVHRKGLNWSLRSTYIKIHAYIYMLHTY